MSPLLHINCPIIVSQRPARLDSPRVACQKAANPPEEALAAAAAGIWQPYISALE